MTEGFPVVDFHYPFNHLIMEPTNGRRDIEAEGYSPYRARYNHSSLHSSERFLHEFRDFAKITKNTQFDELTRFFRS